MGRARYGDLAGEWQSLMMHRPGFDFFVALLIAVPVGVFFWGLLFWLVL